MAWPPDPIAADKANATDKVDDHAPHHNALADAINDLVAFGPINTVAVPSDITATGTASASTFLRGDGAWAEPAGGGGGSDTWRQMLWPVLPFATVGNWAVSPTTAVVFNIRTDGAASHVQNDSIEWEADLSAGTWTFELRFLAISSGGIATLSIDGTDVGEFDTYAATSANNSTAQITGATIGTTSSKRIKLTMATRNASSSGFRCYMTYLAAQRTA